MTESRRPRFLFLVTLLPAQINPTQVRPDAMYAAVISPVDICCGYFSLWLLSPVDNWCGYCPPWTSAVVILSWTSVAVISPVDICVKLPGKCSSSCSSSVVIQSKECAASCLQNPATSVLSTLHIRLHEAGAVTQTIVCSHLYHTCGQTCRRCESHPRRIGRSSITYCAVF